MGELRWMFSKFAVAFATLVGVNDLPPLMLEFDDEDGDFRGSFLFIAIC